MRSLLALLLTVGLCCSCGAGEHARGRALYRLQGCHTCHGESGQGTVVAPALRNLDGLWNREDLIEYLANPRAFVEGNQRLRAMRGRFNMEMPAIMASPDERAALADYVLTL